MLMDRIIGAFTFKKGVYSEVEHDTKFTQTAWLLVALVALLSQLGAQSSTVQSAGFLNWLLTSLLSAVFAVVGFGLAAFVISWVGKGMFNADVSFEEVVRTLGLAYVWNLVGFLGVVGALSPVLTCVVTPVVCIGALLSLVAWLFAVKEALDLEWLQTVITVIIGFIVIFIINTIAGMILGIFGLSVAGLGSLLQGL